MKNMLLKQMNMTSRTICEQSQLWSINDGQFTSSFIGSYRSNDFLSMLYTLKNNILMFMVPSHRLVPNPTRCNL